MTIPISSKKASIHAVVPLHPRKPNLVPFIGQDGNYNPVATVEVSDGRCVYQRILVAHVGWTVTASSQLNTAAEPGYGKLVDRSGTTGVATLNNSNENWIQVDFGKAVEVKYVLVGGGTITGVSDVAATLNASTIQSSNDGINWINRVTITGVTNTGSNQFVEFELSPTVTARYWRIRRASGQVATTEFRFNRW